MLTTMVVLVPYRQSESADGNGGYYVAQAGGDLPVYAGRAMMGKGLGNVFGGLLRAAAPVLKKIGTTVGKWALKAGVSVSIDLLGGKNIRSSLKRRAQEAGGELLGDLASAMSSPPKRPKKSPQKKVRKSSRSAVSRRAGQTVVL